MKMSEELTIYYTPDAKTWAEYLRDTLNSKAYNIAAVLKDIAEAKAQKESKVNIILISPDLIELDNWDFMKDFDSSTSIAVLTGVDHGDWTSAAINFNMESVLDWFDYQLLANEESVTSLIIVIISLYESIIEENTSDGTETECQTDDETELLDIEEDIQKVTLDTDDYYNVENGNIDSITKDDPDRLVSNSSPYEVLPSSKPVNTISYVFRQGGYGYIVLEDTHSGMVKVKFHDREGSITAACVSEKATVYAFPHDRTERESFDVTLDDIEIGYGVIEKSTELQPDFYLEDIELSGSDRDRVSVVSSSSDSSPVSSKSFKTDDRGLPPRRKSSNAGYVNMDSAFSEKTETSDIKSTLPFTTPCTCTCHSYSGSDIDLLVPSSSTPSSRNVSQETLQKLDLIQRLLEDVTDPVSVLCQSLKVANDIKELDQKLTLMLKSTEALKQLSHENSLDFIPDKSDATCPTLMHLGAKYGLTNFCRCLLENAFTRDAVAQRDKEGCFPHEVARLAGHTELADVLENSLSQLLPGTSLIIEGDDTKRNTIRHKDLRVHLGMNSSSILKDVPKQPLKKQGVLDRLLFGKRSGSDPRIGSEEMAAIHGKPQAGNKTQVYKPTNEVKNEAESSGRFRNRLSTYPVQPHLFRRPVIKMKKQPTEKEMYATTPDEVMKSVRDSSRTVFSPDVSSEKDVHKEIKLRGKKKTDKKEQKKEIQQMIAKANKRPSMRIRQARKHSNASAPALPARPGPDKSMTY